MLSFSADTKSKNESNRNSICRNNNHRYDYTLLNRRGSDSLFSQNGKDTKQLNYSMPVSLKKLLKWSIDFKKMMRRLHLKC